MKLEDKTFDRNHLTAGSRREFKEANSVWLAGTAVFKNTCGI